MNTVYIMVDSILVVFIFKIGLPEYFNIPTLKSFTLEFALIYSMHELYT